MSAWVACNVEIVHLLCIRTNVICETREKKKECAKFGQWVCVRMHACLCVCVFVAIWSSDYITLWALVGPCDRTDQACSASLDTHRHTPGTCRQSRLTVTLAGAHACTHTHVQGARCDAEFCGDQWESTLGLLAEAIKREWIMRLFIDWSICNQGILLWRSPELFLL